MRLSELVARCGGTDPELAVEDEHGIPRPVVSADVGVMLTDTGHTTYVLLEAAQDDN